jgi:hypothetical protein
LSFHHLDGDVRAVIFALETSNAAFFFDDFVPFKRENLNRADLHTDQTSLTVDLVPNHVSPWDHNPIAPIRLELRGSQGAVVSFYQQILRTTREPVAGPLALTRGLGPVIMVKKRRGG